jgi:hypothetical protein
VDEARKWLKSALLWIGTAQEASSGQPWNQLLEIQLFRREAEALLKGAKP